MSENDQNDNKVSYDTLMEMGFPFLPKEQESEKEAGE